MTCIRLFSPFLKLELPSMTYLFLITKHLFVKSHPNFVTEICVVAWILLPYCHTYIMTSLNTNFLRNMYAGAYISPWLECETLKGKKYQTQSWIFPDLRKMLCFFWWGLKGVTFKWKWIQLHLGKSSYQFILHFSLIYLDITFFNFLI